MVKEVQISGYLWDLANKSAELTIFNNELEPRLEKLLGDEDISLPISKLTLTKKVFERKKAALEARLLKTKNKSSSIKQEIADIERLYKITYTVVKGIVGDVKSIDCSIDHTDPSSLGFWSNKENTHPELWDLLPLFDYGPYHPEYLEGEWEDFAESKLHSLIDGFTDGLLLKHLEEINITTAIEIQSKFIVSHDKTLEKTVYTELRHLTKVWDDEKKKPMYTNEVFSRMVQLIVQMISNEKSFDIERKIPSIYGAPKQVLLASLGRLHDIVYDCGRQDLPRREFWYDFIINTFEDFENYKWDTIRKKFKSYLEDRSIHTDIPMLLEK